MLEAGRPTTIVHEGWSFAFPHSESRMIAYRSLSRSTTEFTRERFRDEYRERYGKPFRG